MRPQYRLHSGDLLRRLIDTHRDGEPGTIREIADVLGVSKSKVQALIDETRPSLTRDQANWLAAAYHLPRRALSSRLVHVHGRGQPSRRTPPDESRGALAEGASRRAHELGEHSRPGEQDGEGASRGERPLHA